MRFLRRSSSVLPSRVSPWAELALLLWQALTAAAAAEAPVARLELRVLAARPHDPAAFTQGLLVYRRPSGERLLFESTGLYGGSTLREVDLETGEVLRRVSLPPNQFGEGLALVGDRLIQLTWREEVAHVYDRDTFQELGEFPYEGEGWGLCFDGHRLIMSDGSSRLTFRSPETFEVLGSVDVTLEGSPQRALNELEWVDGFVYANVWQRDYIVKIEPGTGEVVAVIDAAGLLTPQEEADADVLNGIAYDDSRGLFLITGKLWPRMFEVTFVDPSARFIRGDCSGNAAVDISDAVCALNWLFLGAAAPVCLGALDTNGDRNLDVSDPTYLLNYLFLGGPPPALPFPACGALDPALEDALGCQRQPSGC